MLFGKFSQERFSCWGEVLFCLGMAMFLVLSEVFSSNIQSTLPEFSHLARLALTGGGVLLLGCKCLFFTRYTARWQPAVIALCLAYAGFAAWYGDDVWFFLAVLAGFAAYGVDLRRSLQVYLAVAVAGVLLVQLLHLLTPLVPFGFYCRNWDYGYGHYNGYGARLWGIFVAWGWLRWPRLRWFDWAGLAALLVYTALFPGARGAMCGMLLLLLLFVLARLAPRMFRTRVWQGLVLAAYPLLTAVSLLLGWFFDPERPTLTPLLAKVNSLLSGRLEIWHHVFWSFPYTHPAEDGMAAWYHDGLPNTLTLLGGLVTDGDVHHAMDNTYLALIMNKGILGAALLAVGVVFLIRRLGRRGRTGELLCVTAMLAYLLMENKPFLISANPLFLLLPVLLIPRGEPLPQIRRDAE